MTFGCTIEHTAGKDNHFADALSRMHKYPGVSTTEDDHIPHRLDSTTIRPLQEINSNHINFSDHSATSTPTYNHPYHNMPYCGAINFTHVDGDFNKCRGRAENCGHYHSCPYLEEEDMEHHSEDDYKLINQEDKEVSSDKESPSPIPEELFETYKAPSTNVNLTDVYKNLWIVPSQTPLLFRFTTSSPVKMRNEFLDHLTRLLEGIEKPILTPNRHKQLSNEDLAAIVRNANKNVNSQLDTIQVTFQQHHCQHWTDCHDYYCKSHGSSHQMRGSYIALHDTICSICGDKRNR